MGKKKQRTKKQLELETNGVREHDDENGESEWVELSEELEARVMLVTPAIASRWLEKNHEENRPIRWQAVEAIANDIRSGAFKLTHQAVAFGDDGFLLDGQHRLSAVVAAGETVRMLVMRNRAGAFSDPIDRGRPRSVSMLLRISNREAAALNVLRWLELGGPTNVPATAAELAEVLERHAEPLKMIKTHVKGASTLIGSLLAACVYAMPCDPDRVLAFAYKVRTGEMLQKGDPAYAFRIWQERNAGHNQWDAVLAALNCVRYFVTATPLMSVYTGEAGYKGITGRRRALKIPHTPSVELVPLDGGSWKPSTEHGRGELLPRGSEVEADDAKPLRVTPATSRGGMPGVDPFRPRGA
jgi:hypothetical protein